MARAGESHKGYILHLTVAPVHSAAFTERHLELSLWPREVPRKLRFTVSLMTLLLWGVQPEGCCMCRSQ